MIVNTKNQISYILTLSLSIFLVGCQSNKATEETDTKESETASGWLPENYRPKNQQIFMLADSALQLQTAAIMDPTLAIADREQKLKAAFSLLTTANELDPKYGVIYSNMAAIYLEFGDTLGAIDKMRQRLELEPELAEGWQAMGFFYDKMGDSTKAFSFYQKSIEHFDARLALGKKYSNPQDVVYYYDNMAGKAYSLLLLGKTADSHATVHNMLDEAALISGEDAGAYAALLTMNRWTMLESQ